MIHKTIPILLTSLCFFLLSFSLSAQQEPEKYVINRGDILDVRVMEHPEFSISKIYVLPDGTLQYPGFGSILVAGMTTQELKDTIEISLEKYVVNPIVTIFVRDIKKQAINVFGFVNKPGQYQIFEEQELFFALGLAGGIKDMNKAKTLKIIRANGETEEVSIRKYMRNRDDESEVIIVNPGDTVYVVEPVKINWSLISTIATIINTAALVMWRLNLY
ncbi:MAG: polysaccharide biosynthesis/export family protein [Bacteroidales bacterium]